MSDDNVKVVDDKKSTDIEEERTVSVEEMKRRIANEKDKAKEEIDKLNGEFNEYKAKEAERIQQAIDEFSKKEKMNQDELYEYTLKEKEKAHNDEVNKLKEEIEAYKNKERLSQIKDIAINKLAEFKIESSDKILSLVLSDSIEDTSKKIDALNELLEEERNKYIGQDAPVSSGGLSFGSGVSSTYDMLKKLKGE